MSRVSLPFQPAQLIPFSFPLKGKSSTWARTAQPQGTTPDCLNVLPYDLTGRARGGVRTGFSKLFSSRVGGAVSATPAAQVLIQADFEDGSDARASYLVVVAGGLAYVGTDATSVSPIGDGTTNDVDPDHQFIACTLLNKVYITDNGVTAPGDNLYEIDPLNPPSISVLAADAGKGVSPAGDGYRLCCAYRGRLVVASPPANPQTWAMSRSLDPGDWDYGKRDPDAAVAAENSNAGQVGEAIEAMIPYGDDLLLFGCQRSLWLLAGDPGYGGVITQINRGVGVLQAASWALDPDRNLYFVGTGGFYRLRRAGYMVENLSLGVIEQFFEGLTRTGMIVTCQWDRQRHGCWIFCTLTPQGTSTHIWWDETTGGFFPQQFPDVMGPTAVMQYDSQVANDRQMILGGWGAYLYTPDPTAGADDGTAIDSFVYMSPVRPEGPIQRGKFIALEVTMGEIPAGFDSDHFTATATLNFADDPYSAFSSPIETSTQDFSTIGRNTTWRVRGRGSDVFLIWSQSNAGVVFDLEEAIGQWIPAGRVRAGVYTP